LPAILEGEGDLRGVVYGNDADSLRENVSTQLVLGSLFSAYNEPLRGPPQEERGKKQESRKNDDKSIRDFEPITHDRRPKFGSPLFAICAVGAAFVIAAGGQYVEFGGRRVLGRLIVVGAFIIGLWGIAGVPLGVDLIGIWGGP
jgi:hypothetical protein